jgi:hypothetical protein
MEKARLAFALAWLISALMPEAASAKAPTVKITISGGPASAVEVTDQPPRRAVIERQCLARVGKARSS